MKRPRTKPGAGCRNRTCFVSLKRRVHSRICQSRNFWWVTLCPIARKSGARRGPRWNRTSLVSLKRRVHQPSLPVTRELIGKRGGSRTHMNLIRNQVPDPFSHTPSYKWCRMLESNQHLAIIEANCSDPLNYRRETSLGRGCRSRTCLAALIWRRSAYKALLLPEAPPLVARDGFEPSTTAL